MKKLVIAIAISGVALGLGSALAAKPSNPGAGGDCVQAGLGTLKEFVLLQLAAQGQIDYSTLAEPVNGPIFAELPEGSFLSLGQVVRLHTSNPELFAWCN